MEIGFEILLPAKRFVEISAGFGGKPEASK
jgi:hypothetical protein